MISQDAANFFLVLVFGPPVIILSLALSEICLTALTKKFNGKRDSDCCSKCGKPESFVESPIARNLLGPTEEDQ